MQTVSQTVFFPLIGLITYLNEVPLRSAATQNVLNNCKLH